MITDQGPSRVIAECLQWTHSLYIGDDQGILRYMKARFKITKMSLFCQIMMIWKSFSRMLVVILNIFSWCGNDLENMDLWSWPQNLRSSEKRWGTWEKLTGDWDWMAQETKNQKATKNFGRCRQTLRDDMVLHKI